jgi:opacity protein-like surface antigen
MQFTRYQLTDDYMNDMSFVVSSYSFGLGLKYNISDHVRVKAAYFQTNYEDYDKVTQTNPATGAVVIGDNFTRTNKVFGLGVDVTL